MLYGEVKRDVTEMELTLEEINLLLHDNREFSVEDGELFLITTQEIPPEGKD